MSNDPIIGGNWATTEPKYRKPMISPKRGRLYKLTDIEIDTLDALSILGGASKLQSLSEVLGNLYPLTDPETGNWLTSNMVEKSLTGLVKFGCVEKLEREYPGCSLTKQMIVTYRITEKGREAFNESLDALEERMMERGGNGIRRNSKRG